MKTIQDFINDIPEDTAIDAHRGTSMVPEVRGESERTDVASPGELVRDADGKPIGCRGLVVN